LAQGADRSAAASGMIGVGRRKIMCRAEEAPPEHLFPLGAFAGS